MTPLSLTFWPSLNASQRGRRARYYPHGFVRVARAAAQIKHDGRGWSPATFRREHRAKDDCESVVAIGLDFDRNGDPRAVADALADFSGFVHTTKKHTTDSPRCRAIVWLSRPINPAHEYEPIWKRIASILPAELAAGLDQATKDASRLWYLPSRDANDNPGIVLELNGAALDVDDLLERIAIEEEPAEEPRVSADTPRPARHDAGTVIDRATAYMQACSPAISGSGGHKTTWSVCRHLAGWMREGLSLSDAQHLLDEWNRRCDPPWSKAEIDRHFARAQKADKLPAHPERQRAQQSDRRNANGTARGEAVRNSDAEEPNDSDEADDVPNGDRAPIRKCTDSGNAERMVDQHGDRLRYVAGLGWFAWCTQRWQRDETGEVHRLAKQTVRNIYGEAARCEDPDFRTALAKWGHKSEGRERRAAMVALAQTERAFAVSADELDRDGFAFNVHNGTIDLRTGKLRPHRREDLITKLAGCAYDPRAYSPTWQSFLERVVPDPELRAYSQRVAGYSLTASAAEHALFFLHGSGQNGKSVFLIMLRLVLGDYAVKAPRGLLVMQHGSDRHPTELMTLRGARLAWCSETSERDAWDESKVKDLASDDPITAHYMRSDDVTFSPTHKLFVAGNHRPRVRGTDDGIWRRLRLIPFMVTIPDEEKDPHLVDKLKAELPGILRWCVDGCIAWQKQGLGNVSAVSTATGAYRESENTIGRFLADEYVSDPDGWVLASTLYKDFCKWVEDEGEGRAPSQKRFGDELTRRGYRQGRAPRTTKRDRCWHGLRERQAFDRSGSGSIRVVPYEREWGDSHEENRNYPDQSGSPGSPGGEAA